MLERLMKGMCRRLALGVLGLAIAFGSAAYGQAADPSFKTGQIAYKIGNYETAARLFLLFSEQGDAKAQYILGAMYGLGKGVPQDAAKAVHWYRKAAEQGIAGAQNILGIMYWHGEGIPQDDAKALHWYRKAAAQGNAQAQYNLGDMYGEGKGVPQDAAKAVHWYRKAAEQGVASAQYNLGVMYWKGRGVPQDFVQAHKWANLVAARGAKDARKLRARLAEKMTFQQIAEAQRLARAWKPCGKEKACS